MSFLRNLFVDKKNSAQEAKDRLTLMLSHERMDNSLPFIDDMKKDIIEVIKKYTDVKDVNIKSSKDRNIDFLELEIVLGKNV